MKRLFLFILCTSFNLYGQKVQFKPTFQHQPIELNKKYVFQNDSLEIETLKFYISNIRFYNNGKLVDTVDKKYFLMDLENPNSLIITHRNKNFDSIKFNIGIDSITNVSG